MSRNDIQAQYGRLVGGIITATTKSGTNKYHGNIFEFHRGDGFGVARNYLQLAFLIKFTTS